MITTRRSDNYTNQVYEQRGAYAGIDVLERKPAETARNYAVSNVSSDENLEEAKIRMQRNLNKLLHYDEQTEERETVTATAATPAVEKSPVEEMPAVAPKMTQEEDIRPTSTTMQFGDAESDGVYNDMNKSREDSKESYRLNAKGKIVVALYALAVTVILALIVLNTGLLASLKTANTALAEEVAVKKSEYAEIVREIEYTESPEFIEEWAINNGGEKM